MTSPLNTPITSSFTFNFFFFFNIAEQACKDYKFPLSLVKSYVMGTLIGTAGHHKGTFSTTMQKAYKNFEKAL